MSKAVMSPGHRSITIRGERVRLYRMRYYWMAHQGDRTFVFQREDDGRWHLYHELRNRIAQTAAGSGSTMQAAVAASTLPLDSEQQREMARAKTVR